MFCTNCGKKIPDDSVFCEHCGAKVELDVKSAAPKSKQVVKEESKAEVKAQPEATQNVTPKKPMSKNAKIGLFGGIGAGALLIFALLVWIVIPKPINMSKFIVFESGGYDGYGKASVYIDWDAFEKQYGKRISFSSKVKKGSYGLSSLIDPVYVLESGIGLEQSNFDYLSNGDTVTVNIIVSDEVEESISNKFSGLSTSYSIKGLGELTKIDLLSVLDEPYVKFSGPNTQTYASPKYKNGDDATYDVGDLTISVKKDTINIVKDNQLLATARYAIDEEGPFSNGDIITLRLVDADELIENGYGPKENAIKIQVADRPELITSGSVSKDSIEGYVISYVYEQNMKHGYEPYSDHCYRNERTNSAFALTAKSSTVTDSPYSILIDFEYEYAYPGYRKTYTSNYHRYVIMHNPYIDNNSLQCTDYEDGDYYGWSYSSVWDIIDNLESEYDIEQIY